MTTSAFTAPSLTLITLPFKQLRAESRIPSASVISITQGALMSAMASLPGAKFRFLTLSQVTTATNCSPPGSSMVTSELTAPSLTVSTVPFKTVRALTFIGVFLSE